jgi:hypothetical protein
MLAVVGVSSYPSASNCSILTLLTNNQRVELISVVERYCKHVTLLGKPGNMQLLRPMDCYVLSIMYLLDSYGDDEGRRLYIFHGSARVLCLSDQNTTAIAGNCLDMEPGYR